MFKWEQLVHVRSSAPTKHPAFSKLFNQDSQDEIQIHNNNKNIIVLILAYSFEQNAINLHIIK